MSKTILVAGCNGYIGNALVLRLLSKGHKVIGIDNDIKEKWLKEIDSFSVMPTYLVKDKIKALKKIGNYTFHRLCAVMEWPEIKALIQKHSPDTIVNLAQQPSAAFSQKSLTHATETFVNNNIGTLNFLHMIRDINPNIHYIEIESMGTYQPEIGVPIPEGLFQFEFKGKKSKPSLFPRRAGSWYHASKVNNTYSLDAANRWWNLTITAINQGIVYGNYTPEIEETKIHSPLYVDECFGTVVNRFIVQMLLEYPLTVYGEGNQKRGFLSLNDSIQCLELLIDTAPTNGLFRIVNQLDQLWSINDIANEVDFYRRTNTMLKGGIETIDDPRIECTSKFYYGPETDILKDLGFKNTRSIQTEIDFALQNIDMDILEHFRKHIIPKIKW